MGLKIFLGFIAFYIGAISYLSLFSKKFKDFEFKEKGEVPLIKFSDIESYDIDAKGTDTIIKAKEALRFSKYDKLKKVNILTFKRGMRESLRAEEARYEKDTVYLSGNVFYEREDNLTIKTQKVVYDTKKEFIFSQTPFVLTDNKIKIEGNSFGYNKQKGIIKATHIKALIKETEKL